MGMCGGGGDGTTIFVRYKSKLDTILNPIPISIEQFNNILLNFIHCGL